MSTGRHWSLTLDTDALRSMIADAWAEIPDDMTGDYDRLADAVSALVEQRDEARAERDRPRVDDRNATAIANVARREGYAAALSDVDTRIAHAITWLPRADVAPYMVGWLDHAMNGAD